MANLSMGKKILDLLDPGHDLDYLNTDFKTTTGNLAASSSRATEYLIKHLARGAAYGAVLELVLGTNTDVNQVLHAAFVAAVIDHFQFQLRASLFTGRRGQ